MAQFVLHLLQIEIQRYFTPPFDPNFNNAYESVRSQIPQQILSNVPSSLNLERFMNRNHSEEAEKVPSMDNIVSTQDSDMISSLHIPNLSPRVLESLWECHERTAAPEDAIISSSALGTRSQSSDNHFTNVTLTSISTDDQETPLTMNPDEEPQFPNPIALHFEINCDDNDLLIQGRQGIGSFDICILSSDMKRVSLSVSGQLIHFTYENSGATSPSTTAATSPSSCDLENESLSSCRIHLDIVSLSMGYIQAVEKRKLQLQERGSFHSAEPANELDCDFSQL